MIAVRRTEGTRWPALLLAQALAAVVAVLSPRAMALLGWAAPRATSSSCLNTICTGLRILSGTRCFSTSQPLCERFGDLIIGRRLVARVGCRFASTRTLSRNTSREL